MHSCLAVYLRSFVEVACPSFGGSLMLKRCLDSAGLYKPCVAKLTFQGTQCQDRGFLQSNNRIGAHIG